MKLEKLQEELTKLEAARDAILSGAQSYTVNSQTVTRANLNDILKRIDVVESRISALQQRNHGGFKKAPLFGA